jgi:hypothetical protein
MIGRDIEHVCPMLLSIYFQVDLAGMVALADAWHYTPMSHDTSWCGATTPPQAIMYGTTTP